MDKSKVAISLRLSPILHIAVRQIAEIDKKSMNDVISDSIDAYVNSRVLYENLQTYHPDFHIRIEKYLTGVNDLTLYSSYAGTDHMILKSVSDEHMEAAIKQLCTMIEFIDKQLIG